MLDELTEQYYCEECGILYDREELETKVTVPILFLSFFMWIPILNLVLIRFIEKSKPEDKKAYYSIFLSSMLLNILLFMVGGIVFKSYKAAELKLARQTLYNASKTLLVDGSSIEEMYDIRDIEDIRLSISDSIQQEKDKERNKQKLFDDELVTVINGANVSGEHVRYLINRYPDYAYLLQTKALRSKNQNINIYLNVGRFIREAESGSVRTIDCSLQDKFTLLTQSTGYELLDDNGTIYYIYDTEMFRVGFIYDTNDKIIGMSFSELEV
jgi:hypothetical protein